MFPPRYLPVGRATPRRGAIAVLVSVMLIVFLAMAAFATDVGHLTLSRTTLRAAADAAALAAAGSMTQTEDLTVARNLALEYATKNVDSSYGNVADESSVVFGVWDPESQTFTPDDEAPNGVRVALARTLARGNPVPSFFGKVLGHQYTEMQVEAIAVGAPTNADSFTYNQVYVTSSKDLSNVVLEFADGTHQKFEGLSKYAATFQGTGANAGKEVVGVWIKSGCNASGEGPGYGERVLNPMDGSVAHGANKHGGCTPHVTATFQATGAEFTESGFVGPVRLVK
jgi:Flp pilus assembly protein TadG